MPKRSRDLLTGGTGDVNPQWFKMKLTQITVDFSTTGTFPLPVQRLPNSGRAQVMEILKIYMIWTNGVRTVNGFTRSIQVSTSPSGLTASTSTILTDGRTIFYFKHDLPSNALDWNTEAPNKLYDVTDGAGHGILVATDSLSMMLTSSNTGSINEVGIWLLYRWKDVSLPEYVGIVQSQS